jgi:adenosylhomocysteine nucleosidase
MEDELAVLRQELDALGGSKRLGFAVETLIVGIGPNRSWKGMSTALSDGKRKPEGVLMLGVAGALEPGRETGELILAGRYFLDSDGRPQRAIPADEGMLQSAEAAAAEARLPVTRGNSLTVDHLICEGWERQQLREKYGTDSVNMEDHAVASAAADAGIPFLSVRVVLDTAEQRLPGYLPKLSESRHAMFNQVLMRPWRILTLRRLRLQMELCQAVLSKFGMKYLENEAERRRSDREKASAEAIY